MSAQPTLPSLSPPPNSGISPADWQATPASVRALVLALLPLRDLVQTLGEQVQTLQQQVQTLQQQIADLKARVNQHSANSSRPPSSDPPSAPPRTTRPASPRHQGAQPGHAGSHRPLLPPEQVDELIVHLPTQCPYCQATLPLDLPLNENKAALRQQVWDLPPIRPHVTEHQFPTVTCPHCQHELRAPQPQGVWGREQALPPAGGAFGPQVTSMVGLLHGRYRLSARETAALLLDLFGLSVSLGSIPALCQSVSEAVAPVYEQVQAQVEAAPSLNVDETGWKEAGAKRWLWVAVAHGAIATVCTLFMVTQQRSAASLRRLLGGVGDEPSRFGGVVGSDRFKAYLSVPVGRRQLCWAHLKRNLIAFHERDGPAGDWGGAMLEQVGRLFAAWHAVCEGELDHSGLVDSIAPVQEAMWELLRQGQSLSLSGARAFSRELLKLWPALWTFAAMEGVEPTNNAAERALRPAVLWRKGCFGAQSASGNEFVERILTVTATCQQQERHVLTFLTQAVQAHWSQLPAPSIIPG